MVETGPPFSLEKMIKLLDLYGGGHFRLGIGNVHPGECSNQKERVGIPFYISKEYKISVRK